VRALRRVLRVERHELGPRVHVAGMRVHEWMLGVALLTAVGVLLAAGVLAPHKASFLLAGIGAWLVAKDRHDLVPGRRDRARWSLGMHRLDARRRPRGSWVPPAAAAFAALTALVNLESALSPNIRWRGRLLRSYLPDDALPLSHALAVPLCAALLLAALFLVRRRYRAWQGAIALLVALGAVNLLKGLAYEEALLSWAAAAVVAWGRPAFVVAPAAHGLRSAARLAAAVLAGTAAFVVGATWVSLPGSPGVGLVLRETVDLLLWEPGPVTFRDELGRMPLAIGLVSLSGLLIALWTLFRPLAAPRGRPDGDARRRARELVRGHGRDTLAYFKLRGDQQYLFGRDGRAFLGYRVENGVLVVAGDPVGEAAAVRALVDDALALAARHGLRFAAVGASAGLLPLYRELGLRASYLGDEAILDTASFSLEGRAIRKVRQSVSRLEKLGYTAELHRADELDGDLLAELERVSAAGLLGGHERGFSMAMDTLSREDAPDALVVVGRDARGAVGGLLHYVPTFGRAAASLALMRRRPGTPNGLTEFLVCRSVAQLRERGIEELSLNFAVLGRYLREPSGLLERLAARGLRLGDRWFQLERLYRFNAKFFPRWEPRFLVYESAFALLPSTLAVLWVEGHLPKPSAVRRAAKPAQPAAA
jgi:lysyl-tRNA synthetase class 2